MNYTLKAIQTVAISLPIILCSETTAQAEDVSDADLAQNGDRSTELPSQTAQDLKRKPTPNTDVIGQKDQTTSVIAQSVTQSTTKISDAPKKLNPSANPLKLPTKPSEVNIEIDQQISLQQAVELAIRNNQNLQEARLNLERSQKELREAKAALYPRFGAELNFSEAESTESAISLELARQQGNGSIDEDISTTSFDGSLNLTYDVYTGGLRGADIKRAEQQVRFSKLDLERITFEIRFEAIRDYYNLQNADSQVEIEQAAVDEAQQTLQDAQLLQQAGIGTNFDVIRAEVELANAQQRLATVTAEQSTARRQLATTLSVGQQVDLKTADQVKPAGTWQFSLEESIVTAYKNRAELEQLLVEKEINQKQKQIALSAVRPQLSLLASYNILDVGDDNVSLTDGYSVGARLSWDLYDGGAASARAKQSETDIAINEAQFADQRHEIRLEVEQGYFSLAASRGNITTSQKALELANESLNLARMRFQSGVGTQTDVIQAQSELTTARGNYLRAIIEFNQSLNQLERAVTNLPNDQLNNSNL